MPFNPFSVITSKVFAVTSGVLLIALGVMLFIHKNDLATADKLRTSLAQTSARLAVSNTSIELLQAKIGEMNADADRRATAYTAAQKQAQADAHRLTEQAKGSDALIARLRARGAQTGSPCPVPADLRQMAEGL